jgi:hypothetical protein
MLGNRPLAVANDDLFAGADFLQILSEAVSQVGDVRAPHPGSQYGYDSHIGGAPASYSAVGEPP